MPRQRFQRLQVIGRRRLGPGRDGAFLQGQGLVGHHKRRIEIILYAKPVTLRAGAVRVVEAEQPRLDLRDGEAGDRAGEFDDSSIWRGLPSFSFSSANSTNSRPSARPSAVSMESGRRLPMSGFHHDAVDHDLDVVLELLVQRRRGADLVVLAVHLGALEALLLQLGQFLAVLALAAAHDRAPAGTAACLPAAPGCGRPSG